MQATYRNMSELYLEPIGAYYLPVTNNRLSPKYCLGELIIADPQKSINPNDYAVFWLNPKHYVIAKANDNLLRRKRKWGFWKNNRADRKHYLAAHKIVGCIEITPNHYRLEKEIQPEV